MPAHQGLSAAIFSHAIFVLGDGYIDSQLFQLLTIKVLESETLRSACLYLPHILLCLNHVSSDPAHRDMSCQYLPHCDQPPICPDRQELEYH